MKRYLARRVASVFVVLGVVSLGVFLLVRLLPGDPVEVMLGTEAGMAPWIVEDLRRLYGLDRPILVQYMEWLGKVVRGDLGYSIRSGQPVIAEVLRYLPVTLEIAILAIVFAAATGIPLGIAFQEASQYVYDYFHSKSSRNRAEFRTGELDALATRTRIETNAARREALFWEVQSEILELSPVIYLYTGQEFFVMSPAVKGYRPMPNGARKYLRDTWLDQ